MAAAIFKLLPAAMVDALNLRTFSIAAEAERGYRIALPTTATEDARILVVPDSKTSGLASRRAAREHVVSCGVTVLRRHGGKSGEDNPVEREDKIVDLAQEVEDFLTATENVVSVNVDGETWTATPTGVSTSQVLAEWLDEGVIAVSMTVDYRVLR